MLVALLLCAWQCMLTATLQQSSHCVRNLSVNLCMPVSMRSLVPTCTLSCSLHASLLCTGVTRFSDGINTHIDSIDVQNSLRVWHKTEVDEVSQGPHSIAGQQSRPKLLLDCCLDLVRLSCMANWLLMPVWGAHDNNVMTDPETSHESLQTKLITFHCLDNGVEKADAKRRQQALV